nr:hypothetical protein GCM10025699_23470 [Microbacterium flavescens]
MIALVVVGGILAALLVRPEGPSAAAPTPSASPTVTVTPTPSPTPTPTGFPANTATYDVTQLPQVNVFAVIPQLPVDDDPFTEPTGETALAVGIGAPVWADPAAEPVAYVPREFPYDGTTMPVVERQDHWVRVLLTGRQAVPSKGDASQVSGWLRVQDVEFASTDAVVEVGIAARTVDIVRNGTAERIATDFGWGTDVTPTPLGRTYIMTTRVVPEFWYTRGHPIIYLAVQSPTLDGFGERMPRSRPSTITMSDPARSRTGASGSTPTPSPRSPNCRTGPRSSSAPDPLRPGMLDRGASFEEARQSEGSP